MAATRRLVITDHTFTDTDPEARMASAAGAVLEIHQCGTETDTVAATRGADVVLTNLAPITGTVLAGLAPGAAVIRYGVGVDNIDLAAAARHGVRIANVPDYDRGAVADHAVTLLLTLLRRLPAYDRAIRDRGWCRPADIGPLKSFGDTTVGLIGVGRVGLATADRLRPFGFRVLGHDPYASRERFATHGVEPADLATVLAEADALSLHVPATEETTHLLDAAALARTRCGVVVVNTARGKLIDTPALVDALRTGQVSAAGLDVFEEEPLPADSPLRALSTVVLTPHAAFYTEASENQLRHLAVAEARRALTGEPLRCPVALPTVDPT